MIPKIFHFIWVGDESKRPDNCIDTWRAAHPDWQFRIWGNAELEGRAWVNGPHIAQMRTREMNGVADMMRWEILLEHGGVVFDADSVCSRPLDDELLDCEAFACWENEIARPGLIAAGYFGCKAGNPFVKQIIEDIAASPTVINEMAWKTVGPQRLTDCYRKFSYTPLRIYPSHYFIPRHFTGVTYEGNDAVYAHQLWGSTLRTYDQMHQTDLSSLRSTARPALAPARKAPAATSALHDAIPSGPGSGPNYMQRVPVSIELAKLGRTQVLTSLCAGQRVLHVGCADWPITNPDTSLHVALDKICGHLDGLDSNAAALDALRPHVKGNLYTDFAQVTDGYDVVLAPDIIENVGDVGAFLSRLETVQSPLFLIAVRDAAQSSTRNFAYEQETGTFIENCPPDHNVWYTPYTFSNTLRKFSGLELQRMWFFDQTSLLALLSKPQIAMAA